MYNMYLKRDFKMQPLIEACFIVFLYWELYVVLMTHVKVSLTG